MKQLSCDARTCIRWTDLEPTHQASEATSEAGQSDSTATVSVGSARPASGRGDHWAKCAAQRTDTPRVCRGCVHRCIGDGYCRGIAGGLARHHLYARPMMAKS